MIKTIALAHRKTGLTREEYNRYWLEKHGPLAARLIPNIRRYVQNHFIEVPGMEFQGDGIVEMWYDSVEDWQDSMKAIQASPDLIKDGESFAVMKPGGLWVVEEHVIMDNINR